MDAYTCIRTKRDTRAYQDKPIPEESLRRILQAGRMAGSAKNLQPCRFVVVQDTAKKKELATCGQFAQHIVSAPVVVAIVLPEDGRQFDAGRCAQNMMLAAWAEGITSCPVTMHDGPCALRVLVVPEGYRVSIVIAFGYPPPSGLETRGAPRIPLEELVHWGQW
ncbi:MAG: nitroreductase family protein [Dehalococcoidia bacterium]